MNNLIEAPELLAAADALAEQRKSICGRCPNYRNFSSTSIVCAKATEPVSLKWAMCPELRWAESMFDRVVILTLSRRADRYVDFQNRFSKIKWPFKIPELVYGIDGTKLPVPCGDEEGKNQWTDGQGAWGCMQSHRQILERAILDGMDSILVLEDDADFVPNFNERLPGFLNSLPPDWDGIMFGGQHMVKTEECLPGMVRCLSTQRTHAYAFRGKLLKEMYAVWHSYFGHCDHVMGSIVPKYKVFAPSPFLIGQRESFSDITYRKEPDRCWSGNDPKGQLIYLEAPTALIPELQKAGVHFGYNFKGVDIGLDVIFKSEEPISDKIMKLRNWGWIISSEAAAIRNGVGAIWHPQATQDNLQLARLVFPNLIEASINSLGDYLEVRRKHDLTARHNG